MASDGVDSLPWKIPPGNVRDQSVTISPKSNSPRNLDYRPKDSDKAGSVPKNIGGSARESNPPTPLVTRHNGFEVRKSHRAPSTPVFAYTVANKRRRRAAAPELTPFRNSG